MDKRIIGNLGAALAALLAAASAFVACRHDFDSPYIPGSSGYAGDDWTRDDDGNGVADSLDKYSPECALPPRQCLENAKIISEISDQPNALSAHDMILWLGDTARVPALVWTPAEGSVRGYRLSSSDSSTVKPVDGRLAAVAAGSAQISVSVPGADSLTAVFSAKVASVGKKVESVSVADLTVLVGRDTAPVVTWTPANPLYADYLLTSGNPEVARVADRKIRGVFPGTADITLESMDGGHTAVFRATVEDGPTVIYTSSITAEDMYLVKDGEPTAPVLHWLPEKVTDKYFKLVSLDTNVVTILDKTQVAPKAPGTTQVYVIVLDGSGATTDFNVSVSSQAVPVKGVAASDLDLVAGADAVPPRLAWQPADATNRKYALSSGQPTVAAVQGGQILPLSMGIAQFLVTTTDGGFQDTFTVTVGRADTSNHVDSVKVANLAVPLGSDKKPSITWYPAFAGNRSYTLTSLDTTIAKPFGELVRPVKVGAVDFRLATVDGGLIAAFKVTVYPPEILAQMVSADTMYLVVGEEQSPSITWTPANATNLTYALKSLDTNYAAIVGGSRVHAEAVGKVRVQVTAADGPTTTFVVVISPNTVKLVSLSCPPFTLHLGDAAKDPPVAFNPPTATDKSLTLKGPAGNSVYSIDAQNRILALAPGKAPLTLVSGENPAITAICTVTVVSLVKSVSAKDDTLRLGSPAKDVTSGLTWDPPNATDKSFSLKSNDTTIVKISGHSYLPVGGGKTTVIVTALDGSNQADTFNVWVKIPVTGIVAKDHTMKTTDSLFSTTPLFTFSPSNATDKNWYLVYTDADASPAPSGIVKIMNGWQLLPQGPGKANVTVVSLDNTAVKDTFAVTVIRPVTGISAAAMSLRYGEADKEAQVTVSPADASDKGFTLTSGNTAVATVVGTTVHAVGPGSAVIKATSAYDASISGSFTVTVTVPVVSLSAATMTIKRPDGDRDPVITWTPANASNRTYVLNGGNPGIATVSANRIHPVAAGIVGFSVTSVDGGKVSTFQVTVTVPLEAISAADITMSRFDDDIYPAVIYSPSDAENKGYTLHSSDTGVASIVNGKIHAVSRGNADITITSTEDPSISDTFKVTVTII